MSANSVEEFAIIDALVHRGDGIVATSFSQTIKFLGIYVGPNAHEIQWKKITQGFIDTIWFIKKLHLGLIGSIVLYNTLALSKYSYVASFVAPPPDVLKIVDWGQQMITCGPWQAFPCKWLSNLKALGFNVEVQDFGINSLAARSRNGFRMISKWAELAAFHKETVQLDDAFINIIQFSWIQKACFFFASGMLFRKWKSK